MKNIKLLLISVITLTFSSSASDEVNFKNLPKGSLEYEVYKFIDISELESETDKKDLDGVVIKNYRLLFIPVSLNIISQRAVCNEISELLQNKSISESSDGEYLYEISSNQSDCEKYSNHLKDLIEIYESINGSECFSKKPMLASKIRSVASSLIIRHLMINARMKYFKVESKRDPVINIINKLDKQLPFTIRSLESLIKSIKLKSGSEKQEDESKSVESKPSLKSP